MARKDDDEFTWSPGESIFREDEPKRNPLIEFLTTEWKWLIGTLIALAGLYIAYRKL